MVPIVVSELQLFEIKREVLFRDAMVLDEPLLGPTPKSLQPVDVDPTGGEVLAVVHFQVPIAAEHEAVIAPELVRVNDTSPANLLDGKL
jgi:hypothetical protein